MAQPAAHFHAQRRYWLLVIVLGLALYIVLPQIGDFRRSFSLLHHLRWTDIWLAAALAGLTYVLAAGTYCLLAFHRLSYRRTLLVQLAAMFINRLLPAGVGALGVGYVYLRRSRHTPAQAATVAAINNILGIIGHAVLVIIVLSLFRRSVAAGHVHFDPIIARNVWLAVAAVILAALAIVYHYRHQLEFDLAELRRQLTTYARRRSRLAGALATSVCLTLTNVLCLWACLAALHIAVSLAVSLIIFTVGLSVGNVTPTPGGLGGVEAGLVAGLVAYHVSSAAALAAVLLYRFITYWLALAVGAVAFTICNQRNYLTLAENVDGPGRH